MAKNSTQAHKGSSGGRYVTRGFTDGLAKTITIISGSPVKQFPAAGRNTADAFRKDWIKLGGDMRTATTKVANGGQRSR